MLTQSRIILAGVTLLLGIFLLGCETTADPELKRAEKSLNEALALGADASASDDYSAAEQLLVQAQELARENKILEARSTAIEAKIRADEAKKKAEEMARILEDESSRLGK